MEKTGALSGVKVLDLSRVLILCGCLRLNRAKISASSALLQKYNHQCHIKRQVHRTTGARGMSCQSSYRGGLRI